MNAPLRLAALRVVSLRLAPLVAALLLGAASAQAADAWAAPEVARLLAAVEDHPALEAARASADAARRELDAVRFPLAGVDASVTGTRIDVDLPDVPLPQQAGRPDALPSGWSGGASVSATLRPFVAGDLADLETSRAIALERAERTVRETRASLQAAALEAAAGVTLAERGVALAEEGLELALAAADAAGANAHRGAATAREHERALLDAQRAQERLRAARARLDEARAGLASLTGLRDGLAAIPLPPAVASEPPAVVGAELDVALARVGLRSSERALLPTAFANYARSGEDGTLGLAIESRTLQPTLSYETPDPSADGPLAELPPGAEARSLTVGLQFSLSSDDVAGRDAAEARVAAAEAGLAAARADADLAALSRREAVRAARSELAFVERERELAALDAEDARRRLELGLEGPLAVRGDELALAQAELAVDTARLDLLSALLRGYRELAVPLSEVLP